MKVVTKPRTIAVCALATLVLGSLAHRAMAQPETGGNSKKVLYEANFNSLDSAFGEPSNQIHAEQGTLTLEPTPDTHYYAMNQGMLFDDMTASVDVKVAKAGAPLVNCGLVFWGKGSSDYYWFYVLSDGRFGVVRQVNGRWVYPVASRANPAIKSGANVVNQLQVVTAGNHATLSINGVQVASIQGQPPEGGSFIGVAAEPGKGNSVCEFTNLKVTK